MDRCLVGSFPCVSISGRERSECLARDYIRDYIRDSALILCMNS